MQVEVVTIMDNTMVELNQKAEMAELVEAEAEEPTIIKPIQTQATAVTVDKA